MWERQLGATKSARIAELVANDRGWADTDPRRALLDSLWKGVGDLTNLPHHPEGALVAQTFDARDAELVLLLTAAVSTYLGRR